MQKTILNTIVYNKVNFISNDSHQYSQKWATLNFKNFFELLFFLEIFIDVDLSIVVDDDKDIWKVKNDKQNTSDNRNRRLQTNCTGRTK